jgi:hypothetical protein
MEAMCSSGTFVTFNGLHGVISQKIVFYITTVVRTSSLNFVARLVLWLSTEGFEAIYVYDVVNADITCLQPSVM